MKPVAVRLFFVELGCLSLEGMEACLGEGERRMARRYARDSDFQTFVKSRGALRTILARFTGDPPESFSIEQESGGKPRLDGRHSQIEFSVSHSKDYAAIALGAQSLGVDIEALDPAFEWREVADTLFHPHERAALSASPVTEQMEMFFQTWAHREAFLKAVGTGFVVDASGFSTSTGGGPVAEEKKTITNVYWHTVPLDAPAGYKAAVAISFSHFDIHTVRLSSLADFGHIAAWEPSCYSK